MKRNYIFQSVDTNNIPKLKENKSGKGWQNRLSRLEGKKIPIRERRRRNKLLKIERKYKRIPKKYQVYIKSKWWTERRNRYFREWGKKCFLCGSSKFIVLHHLEYKSNLFGREPDEMLVQLCQEHHEEFHALYGVKQKMYKEFDDFIDITQAELLKDFR